MMIEESRTPLTLEKLDEVQQRLQLEFPAEYREFLLKYNGGKPTPNTFTFTDHSGKQSDSLVHYFLAIYGNHIDDLAVEYSDLLSDERILPHLVPIANDPFGNLIVLSVGGEDQGKVYFWDHEIEPETVGYENMSLIADSFTEFLNMLT